jgi:hypothetical protein
MSFPCYERYKDSVAEWLGEVPEHWDITRVKRATSFLTGWTPPSGNDLFFIVAIIYGRIYPILAPDT